MRKIIFVLIIFSFSACKKEKTEKKYFVEKPTSVVVEIVKRSTMTDALLSTSTVDSRNAIDLLAEVPGVLTQLWVEEGDTVKKGKRLAKIQRADLGLSVRSAATSVKQLEREVKRLKPLFDKGIVSRQIFDNAVYQSDQAKFEQSRARNAAGNASVKATSNGVIAMKYVNLGQQVAVGTPLFRIIDPDDLVVNVHLPERALSGELLGRKVIVESEAINLKVNGVVEKVSPVVDPRSGTVSVRIAIEKNTKLLSGMFVRIKLVTKEKTNVLVVPRRALIYNEDEITIFVVDDKVAKRKTVEIGLKDSTYAEITSGLTDGEKVIVMGQDTLKNGTLILVEDTKKP